MVSKQVIEAIIGLVLFVYVLAALLPGAITTMQSINGSAAAGYSFWGSSVLALWSILGLFVVIAALLMIYKFVK